MEDSTVDGNEFDRITRRFAAAPTRRGFVRTGLALIAAAAGAGRASTGAVSGSPMGALCNRDSQCESSVCLPRDRAGRRRCGCGNARECPPSTDPCRIASCDTGVCGTVPIPTTSDPLNCGRCGYRCADHPPANATGATCANAACVYSCSAGYGDCNSDMSDGCETTLGTDENCTACGDACGLNASCVTDSQGTSCRCDSGYTDCDGDGNCECPSGIAISNASAACGPDLDGVIGCNIACTPGFFDFYEDMIDHDTGQFNPSTNGCECDLTPASGNCICRQVSPTGTPCASGQVCDNHCRCKDASDTSGQICQPLRAAYRIR